MTDREPNVQKATLRLPLIKEERGGEGGLWTVDPDESLRVSRAIDHQSCALTDA